MITPRDFLILFAETHKRASGFQSCRFYCSVLAQKCRDSRVFPLPQYFERDGAEPQAVLATFSVERTGKDHGMALAFQRLLSKQYSSSESRGLSRFLLTVFWLGVLAQKRKRFRLPTQPNIAQRTGSKTQAFLASNWNNVIERTNSKRKRFGFPTPLFLQTGKVTTTKDYRNKTNSRTHFKASTSHRIHCDHTTDFRDKEAVKHIYISATTSMGPKWPLQSIKPIHGRTS